MATEPERKIEQLLRAYAQKRRDEAGEGFALHPVNRKLLQDEVAKLLSRPTSAFSWVQALSLFWMRVGLAFSIFILLAVALWWVRPWDKQSQQFVAKAPGVTPARSNEQPGLATAGDKFQTNALPDREKMLAKAAPASAPARPLERNLKSAREESTRQLADKADGTTTVGRRSRPTTTAAPAAVASGLAGAKQKKAEAASSAAAEVKVPALVATPAPTAPLRGALAEAISAPAAPAAPPITPPAAVQMDKLQRDQVSHPDTTDPQNQFAGRGFGTMGGGYGGGNRDASPRTENLYARPSPGITRAPSQPAQVMKGAEQIVNAPVASPAPAPGYAYKVGSQPKAATAPATSGPANRTPATQPTDSLGESALAPARARGTAAKSAADTRLAFRSKSPTAAPAIPAPQVVRERFATIPGANLQMPSKVSTSLLDSFVVERSGDQIRIIDADGSVYEGTLLAQSKDFYADETKKRLDTLNRASLGADVAVRASSLASLAWSPNTFSFRVSGMNRTLRQNVQIQASISSPVPSTTTPSAHAIGGRVPGTVPAASPPGPTTLNFGKSTSAPALRTWSAPSSSVPESNAVRLEGTAQVGDTQAIPLRAVRLSP